MKLLIAVLIYLFCSCMIDWIKETLAKRKKRRSPVHASQYESVERAPQSPFDGFVPLWTAFVRQVEDRTILWLAENTWEAGTSQFASIYENTGHAFWTSPHGQGYCWHESLENTLFDRRSYSLTLQLYSFRTLDTLAAPHMENAAGKTPREIYTTVIAPLLDDKKQNLLADFAKTEKELTGPQPYTLCVPVDGMEARLTLGFQKRYQKKQNSGMDGYTYFFNGRTYRDIQSFRGRSIQKLSDTVSIGKDTFGSRFLKRYREIPTFDAGDREWDSVEIEYLICDGRDIHLIIMRGGYHIAKLTFFEKLLTADARMKPLFKKLGWPADRITWVES